MPRTRSLAWSELKIGVLTSVAIAIAAVAIFTLTGTKGFFWQRYHLKTRFPNAIGLSVGSPVRIAGVEVGSVRGIEIVGEEVDLVLEVNKEHRNQITTASVAKLGSVSLLGEGAVDITPSTQGTPLPDWGYVTPGRTPKAFADIADQASEGIDQVNGLLRDLRAGKGTAGKFMTDDRLYNELQQFVATAGQLTRELQQGRGTLGRLLKDPKAAESLEAAVRNVEELTRRINAGEGSLGKLLNDETFSQALTGATTNFKELTDRLNRGEGTAGKLITDATLFNRLNSVTDRFDQLLLKLNEGEGTAGRLLKDRQLYENMNGAVNDLRALITAISKDPKKYLNVKVSIF
jgi:phospholipid/cholesterol/gamma-HCH transport system substrate-binding protein